jgi:predicted O-methyltransferase YrrM
MNDHAHLRPPPALEKIRAATLDLKFTMASDDLTGALLRTLAASKPGGRLLEIGTGTGLATAWLLDGMDSASTLMSLELNADLARVAQTHLGSDPRVRFSIGDAVPVLETLPPAAFDLIFADTWPGKYTHLETALAALKRGGLYVIDDMLPQPNWPDDHAPKVAALIAVLEQRQEFVISKMAWSSGIVVCVRK